MKYLSSLISKQHVFFTLQPEIVDNFNGNNTTSQARLLIVDGLFCGEESITFNAGF